MEEFFRNYDLNDESVDTRYNTNAALYYRNQLKCLVDDTAFNQVPPTYDIGREQAPIQNQMSYEERMS